MPQSIIDNRTSDLLGDVVKTKIRPHDKLSIIAAYFTIYAFDQLKNELNSIDELRLLLTANPFNSSSNLPDYLKASPVDFLGDKSEIQLKNKLDMRKISRECAAWVKKKVQVRAANTPGIIGTKLIHIAGEKKDVAITTSNTDFNSAGLGYVPSGKLVLNTLTDDADATQSLLHYFEQFWDDDKLVDNIKHEIVKQLERGFKDYTPQFIYFFTLYNIFYEYLDDLDEERIVKSKTGFKDTLIWNKLYDFQRDGVLGSIDKIEKHGGCIIADSVGLGKTYEALAVIKYYELRNDRVLVLCPKKLRENWTIFTLNDKRNILVEDRFNYDVLNHTDLSRQQGFSGSINLQTINWGNYDLVVIDESHNFRNNNPRRDTETRYSRLMNEIIKSGVRTKVLMLSATPVNNRMNDLKNQVAFITEGNDMAFDDYGIASIHEVMKRAQSQFNRWLKDTHNTKSAKSLLEVLDARYFKLLDLLTIARSRKHIEKYYNYKKLGKFPDRLKPINIKSDIDLQNLYPPLSEVNKKIRKLNLSAYSPLKYVRADKRKEYSEKYDMRLKSGSVFTQLDREQSLIHLMRVNLLKRMESSIFSFGITLHNLLEQVDVFIDKIQNRSEYYDDNLNIEGIDVDNPDLEDFLIGNKVKVLLQDMDTVRWKQDLLEDRDLLNGLLQNTLKITSDRDAKLDNLKKVIKHKLENPINPGNNKILIFTAFADTAKYLYDNLAPWINNKFDLYTALVVGTGQNKTNLPGIRKDFNEILTFFSPVSKERDKTFPDTSGEIDLLIATDCISEGQNLQDCDFVINYDIHWNPVRIIQRFGRIDRLGSTNDKIQLLNFWPNLELDEYINLEARVSGRMVLLDISATGEENVIDTTKEMNDLEYRRKQLEQLQKEVIDLEDIIGGISITDLTYNDFKMELMEFLKENRQELELTPTSVHAVVSTGMEEAPEGVIFCLKQQKKPSEQRNAYNPLDPYFLVYVNNEGEEVYGITQSKKCLDNYQKLCSGQDEVFPELINEFENQTAKGRNMQQYVSLLEETANHIIGTSREKGTAGLFTAGGTTALNDEVQSLKDFEVVSFLVIMKK